MLMYKVQGERVPLKYERNHNGGTSEINATIHNERIEAHFSEIRQTC